ncbi:uncharacterized protein I303_101341 [Kwoniella dejecticola CBS 10117]|uniref:SnoaL-like domain-containing protein n=1 Tax=Kwoniella dejecticola CBS 10117 TaxID=1296121 RepID=A0A1A6AHH5_9TREE|nr:uncharacterized protein I303_01350 [Kwoniella dejecticola CBS 10117]OBR89522.1 hypothetical protein I303_01350 [Kwoniella dejecticola CBS 10117]
MTISESYAQELIELMLRADFPTLMQYIRDDVEWITINPEVKSTKSSGHYRGKKDFMEVTGPLMKTFKAPPQFTLERSTIAGDLLFVELKGEAIGSKDNKTLTGLRSRLIVCMLQLVQIFEFEENDEANSKPQIKKIKEYMDSALLKEFMDNNLD